MSYVLIGIGGMLGSITRYALGKWISGRWNTMIPLKTLIVNITGAFLLGVVMTLDSGNNLYLMLAEGYLGAYTTFSTFMYEGVSLLKNNEAASAALYIIATLVLGLLGFMAGTQISIIHA